MAILICIYSLSILVSILTIVINLHTIFRKNKSKGENKMSDTFSVKKIKRLKIHEVEGIKLCIDGLYIINVSRIFDGKDIPENAVCRKITTHNNTCYELEVEE